MFMSGWKDKTRKIMILSPFSSILWICQVSVKENTDRKRKEKEERNKEKNTDRAQTKLNSPHVRYNGKILPQ